MSASDEHISLTSVNKLSEFVNLIKAGKSVLQYPVGGANLALRIFQTNGTQRRSIFSKLFGGGDSAEVDPDLDSFIEDVENSDCKGEAVYATVTVDEVEIARVWNDKLRVRMPLPLGEYIEMRFNNEPVKFTVDTARDNRLVVFTSDWVNNVFDTRRTGQNKLRGTLVVGGHVLVDIPSTMSTKRFKAACQKLQRFGRNHEIRESEPWSVHLQIEKKSEEECRKFRQMYKFKSVRGGGRERDVNDAEAANRRRIPARLDNQDEWFTGVTMNFVTSDLKSEGRSGAVRVEIYIPFNTENMAMCFSRHQVACLKQVSQREEFDWLKTSRNVYCPGHWVLYSNLVNQIIRGMVPTKKINREIPVQAKCIAVTRLEDCPIQYTRYISPDEEQLPVDSMQKTLHGSIIDSVQHAQELITWQFGEHHDSRAYTGELYMGIPTGVWKAYRFYDCDLGDYVPNGVITFSPDAQQYAVVCVRCVQCPRPSRVCPQAVFLATRRSARHWPSTTLSICDIMLLLYRTQRAHTQREQ